MAFHDIDVNEIFSSADGTIQFIELINPGSSSGENRWDGRTLTVYAGNTNTIISQYTFTTDAQGPTGNKTWLIATAGFDALPDSPTPDFNNLQVGFLPTNGVAFRVDFAGVDAVLFSAGELPLNGINSITDAKIVGPNSPRNFAGVTGSVVVGNAAPVVANPIADVIAGLDDSFELTFPTNTFTDANGDALTYSAQVSGVDGWLLFDPETRTFSGTPPEAGTLTVELTAHDGEGTVTDTFLVTVISGDVETGGAGADSLLGTTGDDLLKGEGGADTIDGGGGGSDTLSGGAGTDLLLSSVSATLGADFENLTLTGTGDISGTGNAAGNVIDGNEGANALDGGAGNDTMSGGAGNDTHIVTTGDVVEEEEGGGEDTVLSALSWSLSAHVENLTLTGTGNVNATGNDEDNALVGNSGNNVLDGGAGADSMAGGAGNDTFLADSGDDEVSDAGGVDLVVSSAVAFTLGEGIEKLELAPGGLDGTGNGGHNTITGNAADNVLRGEDGNDSLNGGAGSDALYGGAGNDSLKGGQGADSFVFDALSGSAKVLDFVAGQDLVLIDNAVFVALEEGIPELVAAMTVSAASEGLLKYATGGGALYYDADGEGEGALHLIAIFDACGAGAPLLAAEDIVVFNGAP